MCHDNLYGQIGELRLFVGSAICHTTCQCCLGCGVLTLNPDNSPAVGTIQEDLGASVGPNLTELGQGC